MLGANGNYLFRWTAVCCDLIDSYSRFALAYIIKHKSEVLEKFSQFCIDEGVPKTFSPLTLRSDGGGKYDNKAFDEFCFAQGIKREMTAPYYPHQIDVAERRWQTVGNMAKCPLKQANLPNSIWVRAVDVAFCLTNRCLSCSLPPNKTPFELFYGRKPDLSNLKVFCSLAFRFLEVGVKKLDSKAVKEVFVGYGHTHNSYYLYNPATGKISHSRNVSFQQKEILGFGSSCSEDCEFFPDFKSSLDVEEEQVVSSKTLKSVAENYDSALKKHHLCQSLRLQIRILTFMRNSEPVAVVMLMLLNVMFNLLIILRTIHLLNVCRVKRSLTLWRRLIGHNRETNG